MTAFEPEEAPHRSKKNTAKWCRGKVGKAHVPELVVKGYSSAHTCRLVGPFRGIPDQFWSCAHVHRCADCEKVLDHLGPDDCPDRPEEIQGFPGFLALYRKKAAR